MSSTAVILLILAVGANIYHILAAFCGILFRLRQKSDLTGNNWPKAACLKPLCGNDFEAFLNLKSFLNQDYPDYEVIFGTANKEDAAYQIACAVCNGNYTGHAKAVSGEIGKGANRKVRNLRNIYANLSPAVEIIVLSDSDTRVTKSYLKNIIAPIQNDPTVGAATSIYKIEGVSSLGGLLEALAVEATFVPGVLVVATFSDLKYAFGASIAVKHSDFLRAGGFATIEDYLADDYQIGNIIYNGGKRVALSSYVVSIVVPKQSLKNTFAHLTRWNRTIRICEPTGYLFSIICYCTFWAVAAFAAIGANQIGWTVLGGSCIIRSLTAAVIAASIGSKKGIMRAILAPAWDLLSALIWLAGLFGNEVTWRGVKYTLFSDGRMSEIE